MKASAGETETAVIKVKRIYEPPSDEDGVRILVDRLWPRGVSKEAARLDSWLKEISPSHELRRWYGHDPAKWAEFKRHYADEIKGQGDALESIRKQSRLGTVTLLYGSKEEKRNNAVALKEFIEKGFPKRRKSR